MKTLADWVEINPKTTLTKGKTYTFVGMEAITPHQRYVSTSEQRTFSGNGSKFQHLDTLFARITPCLENGKISQFIHKEKSIAFGSTEFFVFRSIPGKSTPSYVYYLTQTKEIQETAIKSMVGASGRQRADAKTIRSIPTELPEVEEQEKISAILSNYDDLIAANQRRIALLEEAAHLIYREWFIHLRFPGHDSTPISDGKPEGWVTTTLGNVCTTLGGGTPSTKVAEYWNGDITWVTPTDVTRNNSVVLLDSEKKISESGLKNSSARLLPPETILMTSRASIGYFALMDYPVCTNQGFISIIPEQDHSRMYLLFNLMNRIEEMTSLATGSTFKELSKRTFRSLTILWPADDILEKFNDAVYPMIQQIRVIKKQNSQLAQARDLLLPKLMSGQIDVSNIQLPDEDVVT